MIDVTLCTMKLSGDREEYWPRITCDGRTFETRRYLPPFKNRAQYEVDMLRHVLLGEPKPRLSDDKYADPPKIPADLKEQTDG
jgi:hypothetical protein